MCEQSQKLETINTLSRDINKKGLLNTHDLKIIIFPRRWMITIYCFFVSICIYESVIIMFSITGFAFIFDMFVTPKAWALRTGSEPFLYKVFGKKIPKYLAPPIITKRKAILIILALLVLHAIACFMALNLHSSASKEILAFIYLLGIIAISQYSPAIIHWMKVSETQYMEEKKQRENWTNNILFLAKPKHRELWNSIIGAYFSFILLISFSLISVCFFSQGLENPSMSENLVFLTAFYMIFLFWVFCVSVIGPITKFNIVKQLIYMEIEK